MADNVGIEDTGLGELAHDFGELFVPVGGGVGQGDGVGFGEADDALLENGELEVKLHADGHHDFVGFADAVLERLGIATGGGAVDGDEVALDGDGAASRWTRRAHSPTTGPAARAGVKFEDGAGIGAGGAGRRGR